MWSRAEIGFHGPRRIACSGNAFPDRQVAWAPGNRRVFGRGSTSRPHVHRTSIPLRRAGTHRGTAKQGVGGELAAGGAAQRPARLKRSSYLDTPSRPWPATHHSWCSSPPVPSGISARAATDKCGARYAAQSSPCCRRSSKLTISSFPFAHFQTRNENVAGQVKCE